MTDINKLNTELIEVAKKIAIESSALNKARDNYKKAKDDFIVAFAKAEDILKTTNPDLTQTDVQAKAIVQTEKERLALRIADSKYHSLLVNLKSLRDHLKALEETGYNLRQEMKLTTYNT